MPATTTILLVDDDEMVRKCVAMVLAEKGYSPVLEAGDANEAMAISGSYQRPIQILLTDVVMPGEMNGYVLARKISDARPETRILLMSGYEENAAPALQEGWHFLRKPFVPSALIETVAAVMAEAVPNRADEKVTIESR